MLKKRFTSKPLTTILTLLFLVLAIWKLSPLISLLQSQATLTNINFESSQTVSLDQTIKLGKTSLNLDAYRVIGDKLQIDFSMTSSGNYFIDSMDMLLEDKNGPLVLSGTVGTGRGTGKIEFDLKDSEIEEPLKISVKDMYLVKIRSLGKVKEVSKSFAVSGGEHVIEYLNTPLIGERYQLTSQPALEGTDIVSIYYVDNKLWKRSDVLKHELPLLLTKEAYIDIVGQQDDYLDNLAIAKLQTYIEENENMTYTEEQIKEGVKYLLENGGTTFYPELNDTSSSRVIQLDYDSDLSGLTFGFQEKSLYPIDPLKKIWLDIISF